MHITSEIKNLYNLYGFEVLREEDAFVAFLMSNGYFNNLEILQLDSRWDVNPLVKEYTDIGYAVKVSKYVSYDETHRNLFNGFFYQNQITQRLLSEYNQYATQQAQKLGCTEYKFVPCKYVGDNNVIEKDAVEFIYKQIFQKGAQLIIVEAAAGFGKTSISYELIKKLAQNSQGTVPLITELSKNRRAQVFKYVLFSEIDAKFRGRSAKLVEKEIIEGNIPIIIDGFDELISKSIPQGTEQTVDDDDESAQTMLSTIVKLLEGESNAKIVLTSRKNAIFAGELFSNWSEKWLKDCEITRIQIVPPAISDWLNAEQLAVLQEKNIQLSHISNPTLLTFLSSKSADDIRIEFTSVEDILNRYFQILLLREKERQTLLLSEEEQLLIMKRLAWNMVDLDEAAFSFEDLKVILSLSVEENEINGYLDRYEQSLGIENCPTEEEFLAKLSHHALLDRIPNTSNLVGFINDFIFGYLIANYLLNKSTNKKIQLTEIKEKYWDLMITAYSVCCDQKRSELYNLLENSGLHFSAGMQLNSDTLLKKCVCHTYKDQYFDSVQFQKYTIIGSESFANCTFTSCIFDKCIISSDAFWECKFYGCQFYDVEIEKKQVWDCNLIFSNCNGIDELRRAANQKPVFIPVTEKELYEKKVLEQYWRPGSDHADHRRVFDTLFKGYSQQDYPGISDAIDRLCSEGILLRKNYCIELNFSQINKIKNILGR